VVGGGSRALRMLLPLSNGLGSGAEGNTRAREGASESAVHRRYSAARTMTGADLKRDTLPLRSGAFGNI
jgi:hypothetical protein